MVITRLKIILHNILAWMAECRNELNNHYNRKRQDIILLNTTGTVHNDKIRILNYNAYEGNYRKELHSGIAIAVRKDVAYSTK